MLRKPKGALHGGFSELLKEAIEGGDGLEEAMRKAAARAAKEAVESRLRAELSALLGYGKHDQAGKNLTYSQVLF